MERGLPQRLGNHCWRRCGGTHWMVERLPGQNQAKRANHLTRRWEPAAEALFTGTGRCRWPWKLPETTCVLEGGQGDGVPLPLPRGPRAVRSERCGAHTNWDGTRLPPLAPPTGEAGEQGGGRRGDVTGPAPPGLMGVGRRWT